MKQESWKARVEFDGRIQLPEQVLSDHGIHPGDTVRLTRTGQNLRVDYSPHFLRRIYLEPTNACNLSCATCMRNQWDEPSGYMEPEIFDKIIHDLDGFSPAPELFLGGLGEPLVHPNIKEYIFTARVRGIPVSLITNGMLLTPDLGDFLIQQKVEWIWVSIDGASPESYSDIRLGAELSRVICNLETLSQRKKRASSPYPRLGIAFVAIKKNIHDLPKVVEMGKRLGAEKFSVSNVIAYTDEMGSQTLYDQFGRVNTLPGSIQPVVDLPVMDVEPSTWQAVFEIMKQGSQVRFGENELHSTANRCPFVEKGSASIRWDGTVSPCLPLMHQHSGNLFDHARVSEPYPVGDLRHQSLKEIWEDDAYRSLRQKLQDFDFSPCVYCNSCENAENNREDCFGNTAPACGGCLWAQGLIRCP